MDFLTGFGIFVGNMRRILFILSVIFTAAAAHAQLDAWVYFRDKPQADYYLSNPLEMLSQRALDRRARYNIDLDITDVPLDAAYYDSIASSPGITVAGRSKWLNAVHVQGDSTDIAALLGYSFVDSIEFAHKYVLSARPQQTVSVYAHRKTNLALRPAGYGDDTVHYAMHNAYALHDEGFTGNGILIAVLDAGFALADEMEVFARIFERGGVVDTYNFPDDTTDVYLRHYHGTMVWSVMGGYADNELIGTAYDADYCLYISEDVYMEMPVEETYWVMAAERADSVGADVINTSLGYIDFDNPAYNHTWDELDGRTAFASRGAQMASEKGMHVIISAGNAGLSEWRKISVPADPPGVVAVGAVDANGIRASFSSTGNTADGRIKPDVMSWGVNVKAAYGSNYYAVSGTSLAAPIITGFTADMVQAFPSVPPAEMKDMLLMASDRYTHPDSLYGYGIPDFGKMYAQLLDTFTGDLSGLRVYPNPVTDELFIDGWRQTPWFNLWNLDGRLIRSGRLEPELNMQWLDGGMYLLEIRNETDRKVFKILKHP